MEKLFVVTRADLPAGDQAVQSCHVVLAFGAAHGEAERWAVAAIALLAVDDEDALVRLADRASQRGVRVASFREPDLGWALTAVALEPGRDAKRLTSGLPLALQPS